jgi:hypothetical protein
MNINDSSQEFVKTLTDKFLADILITAQNDAMKIIEAKLNEINVAGLIDQQIKNTVVPFFTTEIQQKLEADVETKFANANIEKSIDQYITNTIVPRIENSTKEYVLAQAMQKINSMDIWSLVQQKATTAITDLVKVFAFPDKSIYGSAINTKNLFISGDNISGGIIKHLQSTGIQDNATACQVTILDDATVFENKLVANELLVAGDTRIKGNLTIDGTLPSDSAFVKQIVDIVVSGYNKDFDKGTFDQYCNRVLEKIEADGIDQSLIKIGDKPTIENNTLNDTVVNSNLQRVGALRELQVVGETLLDQTLYVANGRMGVNTLEPGNVLDLWDQEVQLVAGKKLKDTAIFGTIRNQNLIITANNKDQLLINTDGTVTIESLNIGKSNHSSSGRTPTDNKPKASIVWNENPIVGAPVGWVSLGGARWASFGIITA